MDTAVHENYWAKRRKLDKNLNVFECEVSEKLSFHVVVSQYLITLFFVAWDDQKRGK